MTDGHRTMTQTAPYPAELRFLVTGLEYKQDWEFRLSDIERDPPTTHQGRSAGLTLIITITCPDSYHPDQLRSVAHYFPVPPATYDERSWRRWLFDRILDVEKHEAMEFFQIAGRRPYAPSHGPGNDPYMIREVGSDADQRTSFRGELNADPR